jgi:hypothetical protein
MDCRNPPINHAQILYITVKHEAEGQGRIYGGYVRIKGKIVVLARSNIWTHFSILRNDNFTDEIYGYGAERSIFDSFERDIEWDDEEAQERARSSWVVFLPL